MHRRQRGGNRRLEQQRRKAQLLGRMYFLIRTLEKWELKFNLTKSSITERYFKWCDTIDLPAIV